VAVPDNKRVRLIFDGMTDIDSDHQNVPVHLDTLLGVAPWPMAFRPEQECLDRYRHLGFKDPVQFALKGGKVSSLVFTNQ
jgi:hypothetical protein